MAIEIRDFRLSFVWFETNLTLLEDVPSNAPYGFLGRSYTYQPKFDAANRADAADLRPPWPKPTGQLFWQFYLQATPGAVGGAGAWKALVPLRADAPLKLKAPWLDGTVSSEAFYYPHGIGWVVTVRSTAALPLEQAVEVAFKVRNDAKFAVQWGDGAASLSLDAMAQAVLPRVRALAWGKNVPAGTATLTPLSIFTVVHGDGVDPNVPVPALGEIHRSLEAVTAWRPTWRADQLPSLDAARIDIKGSAPLSHVMYGTKRGRAVWFPELYLSATKGVQSLSCYHRNLTLVSMQVESLSGLLTEVDKRIAQAQGLPQAIVQCGKQAARLLGALHTGKDTYRSGSARAQLERNGLIPVVNRVRDYFGIEPPLA